ncbi:protein-tyrosine-phosphatase [Telluribacter sp. SYSU D00476]|uniref:protein-tyrosine-phosphatase n=1 Tax=Telluribacter sp. SYSU D00476 TaxID=2811430 RepID=UPI001FF12200|nr:protein-tyrosine-phosphatase [Telluribacter sp. SYSU D00476]
MYPSVLNYIKSLDLSTIPAERRAALDQLTDYVREKVGKEEPVRLTYICTHNSRRSHLGQVWAQVAAIYHDIPGVTTYSGGTETTACNPRTIAAFERAGLQVSQTTEGDNPVYHLAYNEALPPVVAFSKVYDQEPNPTVGFAAIMTCSHAEENCPYIPGAERRLSITYTDPKEADDTPAEAATYDERCRQIATEMMYVFAGVSK